MLSLCNGYYRVNKVLENIMKIVVDENFVFIDYFFVEFGEVEYKVGCILMYVDVVDVKVLLVCFVI